MRSKKTLLLYLVGLIALSWGMYKCKYYYSYYSDLKDRPWAYSEDKNAKLLVGQWQGSFKDPDGVQKSLKLEVFEPVTDEERQEKASRLSRKRRGGGSRENKRAFDGVAVVVSRLGKEEYEIYGSVKKEDFHQLRFNFRPQDEKKRILPNFTVAEAKEGNWQNDELHLTLTFSYHKADGSSFWNSADPRHDKTVKTTLIRQKSE
jgi:hypothetical protein